MPLDPLTSGFNLATTVIEKLWPDKSAPEQAQLSAAVALVQGQLAINQVEASNPSILTSGWRPAIGWICGAACAWNWIGLPIAKLVLELLGHSVAISPADVSEMMPVLLGMLGLGGLRSYEKVKGVAT